MGHFDLAENHRGICFLNAGPFTQRLDQADKICVSFANHAQSKIDATGQNGRTHYTRKTGDHFLKAIGGGARTELHIYIGFRWKAQKRSIDLSPKAPDNTRRLQATDAFGRRIRTQMDVTSQIAKTYPGISNQVGENFTVNFV